MSLNLTVQDDVTVDGRCIYQAAFDAAVKLSLMFVNGDGDYDDEYDNGDGDDVVIVRMMVLYMWIKITLCYH